MSGLKTNLKNGRQKTRKSAQEIYNKTTKTQSLNHFHCFVLLNAKLYDSFGNFYES